MKAKFHYILFATFLFLFLAILIFVSFRDNSLYLFGSEVLWILGVVYAFVVYRKIFKPIELIQHGINALKDEDFNVKFAPSASADINELVGVYNAMIDKIRNERTYQKEQHYFLNLLIEAMPVGVIILDFDHRISEYNPQAHTMFGITQRDVLKPLRDIDHDIGKELDTMVVGSSRIIKMGGVHYYRCTANRFMYKGFPRIFLLVEELSNEILENEKQAYDKVIRMMSHEVNNSIGAINSILESLLSHTPLSEQDVREYLPIIMERNDRLADFMKNFAKVIRLPIPTKARIDINVVLGEVSQLMSNRLTERNIILHTQFGIKPLMVYADRSQLEQAFINIIKNSMEAVGDSGYIKVYTDHDKIIIEDNGEGIPADKKDQLFTPFFSTKPEGQGVGLTLVKEILFNHGWKFSLDSDSGITQFVIMLRP